MIEIKDLSKNWREFSLEDINLTVDKGEYFVILGPTAAGKTLLLELIAGFYQPDSGEIWIDNKNVTGIPPEKRGIGFVYQDYSLFPHLTVKENIAFGLRIKNIPEEEVDRKTKEALDMLAISHLSNRYPGTLSGGEQQRVAIARAIVIGPCALLLDEPLSALDARTQILVRGEMKKIHKKSKLTTIHVTHDQTEAMVLADRIGVMMNGMMVQVGTPNEIFNQPRNEEVAEFVGMENIIEGRVKSNEGGLATIDVQGHRIEAISNCKRGDVRVCIRPEDITISLSDRPTSARNTLHGRVVEITPHGPLMQLKIDCGFCLTALITKKSKEELGLETGKNVCASFKASAVHVIA